MSKSDEIGKQTISAESIAAALKNSEFVLLYQPKVNMKSGEFLGVEALIRWLSPKIGIILPNRFLPIVHETQLEIDIGYWVIDTVIKQIAAWQKQGISVNVSVNLPWSILLCDNFSKKIKKMLSSHGVSGEMLQVEILESNALRDSEQASLVINECQDLGITFALDDFGTGYSSLLYLKLLNIDVIKIDISFVKSMTYDVASLAIIKTIIDTADAFGIYIVAEGVETDEHGELLIKMGCPIGQGYAISKPIDNSSLPQWIKSWKPYKLWTRCSRLDVSRQSEIIERVKINLASKKSIV